MYGDDGKVRSALLKTPNKQRAHYAVNHLYPLEIQTTHGGSRSYNPEKTVLEKTERKVRNAAKNSDN